MFKITRKVILFCLAVFCSINAHAVPLPPNPDDPVAPFSVSLSKGTLSSGSVTITWSGGIGSSWKVYRGSHIATLPSSVRSYTYTPTSDGDFYFGVAACYDTCSSVKVSSMLRVKLSPSTPSKPSNKNSNSTSYTVSWNKPSGTVTFYSVQEKVGSGSWTTISSNQSGTSISRSGKSNNSVYYYRVRACNTYSWSCSSYSSSNTVRVELKPSTPSKPSNINSTSTSYTVSWGKPSGSVNFYQVQERVAGGSWSTIASNLSSTSIGRSGKSNGTNYEYRTRACNSYTWSCSGYSSANSVKVRLKPSTPTAPSRPSTSTGSAAVSWTKPSGNVAYYDLQKRNNNGSWATAKAGDTNTSETVSGLTDGAWDFRVRACNGYSWACSGYSAVSSDTTVRIKPSTPSAPTVPSSDGNGSYTVSWSKPSGTVSYYDLIERKNNSGSFTTVVNNTTATSAALTGRGDGAYDYQVRACNGYDWACSSYSAVSSDVSVLHKPGTPSSISNPSTDADGSITINWGAASGQVGDYRLEEQKNGTWTQVQSGSTARSKSRSLGNGTYHYRVRACNATGCSGYRTTSAVTEIRIRPAVPGAPNNPTTSTGSAAVSWSSVSNGTYYDLQKRNNNGSWQTAKAGDSNTSETISGLTDGGWDFRVRACNTRSWSCSSYSAASSDTLVRAIPSTPAKPTTSVSQSTSGSFSVNYLKPSGNVSFYDVQQRKNNGSWSTIANNTSSLSVSVSNLSSGDYDFRVRACNGYSWACSGYSANSTNVDVRRIPAVPSITKPTSSESDSGNFSVEWNVTADTTVYVLQQRINGGGWSNVQSSASRTYAASSLSNGVYGYRVKACNGGTDVCSGYSSIKSISVTIIPAFSKKTLALVSDATLITPNVPANQAVGALGGKANVSGGGATYSVPIAIPPGRNGMQPSVSLNYSSRSGDGIAGVGWSLSAGSSIYRCSRTVAQDGYFEGVSYTANDKLCFNGERLKLVSGIYGIGGAVYRTEIDSFAKVTQNGNLDSGTTWFSVEHKSGLVSEFGATNDSKHKFNGTVIESWAINKTKDQLNSGNGNNTTYHYTNHGSGEYTLKRIDYTGFGDQNGDRHVWFEYQTLEDELVFEGYQKGALIKQTQLLEGIVTGIGQTEVRRYKLAFNTSPLTGKKRVKSITECAYETDSSETCLKPTEFTWSNADGFGFEHTQGNQPDISITDVNSRHYTPTFADFNGDGLIDVNYGAEVLVAQKSGGWQPVANESFNGQSIRSAPSYDTMIDYNHDGRTDLIVKVEEGNNIRLAFKVWDDNVNGFSEDAKHLTNLVVPCMGRDNFSMAHIDKNFLYWANSRGECAFRPADFNGDGLTDFVVHVREVYNDPIKTRVYLQDDSGDFNRVAGLNYSTVNFSFRADDINGDGFLDLVAANSVNQDKSKILVLEAQFNSSTQNLSFVEKSYDINVANTGNPLPQPYHHLWLDVNGDGLTDLLYAGYDNKYYLKQNTGTGFTDATYAATLEAAPVINLNFGNGGEREQFFVFNQHIQILDYDGDGKDDLLIPQRASDEYLYPCDLELPYGQDCELWESNGQMDNPYKNKWQHIFRWEVILSKADENGIKFQTVTDTGILGTLRHTQVVDIDSDGLMDVYTVTGFDNQETDFEDMTDLNSRFGQGIYIFYNRADQEADLITQVKSGMAQSANDFDIQFNYKSLANMLRDEEYQVSSRTPVFPVIRFASNASFVTSSITSDGIGGELTTNYRYSDAKYHLQGRGFLGFASVITEKPSDIKAGGDFDYIRSVSEYHQAFPLTGQLKASRSCLTTDSALCDSSPFSRSQYGYVSVDTTGKGTWWNISAKSINQSFDLSTRQELSSTTSFIGLADPGSELDSLNVSSSAYDLHGNIYQSITHVDNGYSLVEKKTENTFLTPLEDGLLDFSNVTMRTISNDSAVHQSGLDPVKQIKTTYTWTADRKPDVVETIAIQGGGKSIKVDTDYNTFGMPTRITTSSPNETSRVVNTGYSSDGYFVEWVDSGLGKTFSYVNPVHGQPDSTTDINGLVSSIEYDAFGRAEQVTPPNGTGQPVYTRFAWCNQDCDGRGFATDVASRIVYKQISYSAGMPESIVYKDQFNRTIATATKAFDGSRYVYSSVVFDELGRKVREVNPSHNASFSQGVHYVAYDSIGRLTEKRIDQAYNQSMTVSYVYSGHNTSINAGGLSMSRTYTGNGQLLQTVDANQSNGPGVTQYAYDAMGNPIVLQDANGNAITAKYNSLGQKLWVDDPNMGYKSFAYTGFGEVQSETDANADTYAYQYDSKGRLYERWLNNSKEAEFNFDNAPRGNTGGVCKGLPESEASTNGHSFSRTYGYDQYCRPVQSTTTIDGESFAQGTQYDTNYGRVKAVTYPTGLTLENWYNSDGYLTHQVNAANDYVYHEVTDVDARGQVVEALKANGVLTEGHRYDDVSGQMTEVFTHSTIGTNQRHRIAYTDYDQFGNLKEQVVETTQRNGSVVTTTENYGYDNLHRLIWSELEDQRIDYDYDKVGNLTLKDDYASSFSYGNLTKSTRNAGPNAVHQVTKVGGGIETFTYDNNGNRTHENGVERIRYNAFNKPIWINKGGVVSNFYYGADQMRYKQVKTGKPGGTETTIYVGKAYEEIRYDNKTIKKSYLGDTIITEEIENDVTNYKAGFVHRDRLNSVVTVTDHNGNVVDNKSYDPFGKPRKADMTQATKARLDYVAYEQGLLSEIESTRLTTRRGFTDHEHLDEAELIHMNGRVYDYNLGRFLSVDPFIQEPGNSQSMNPYSYIMNNPLAGTDPSGYYFRKQGGAKDDICPEGGTGNCIKQNKQKPEEEKKKPKGRVSKIWQVVYKNNRVNLEKVKFKKGDTLVINEDSDGNMVAVYTPGSANSTSQVMNGVYAAGGALQHWGNNTVANGEYVAANPGEALMRTLTLISDTVMYFPDMLMHDLTGYSTGAVANTNARIDGAIDGIGNSVDNLDAAAQAGDYNGAGAAGMGIVLAVLPRFKGRGAPPPNLSPAGAGRTGAFKEAKRQSGIRVGQQPSAVTPNLDRRGKVQPGKVYHFKVPAPGGGFKTIKIRDDAGGHDFGPGNLQNRGSHFNDEAGNHYDY